MIQWSDRDLGGEDNGANKRQDLVGGWGHVITLTISVETYGPQCIAQVLFMGPLVYDQAPRIDIPHLELLSDGCAERGTWFWVGGKAGAETPHSRMLGISSTESADFYTQTDTPTHAHAPPNSCAHSSLSGFRCPVPHLL